MFPQIDINCLRLPRKYPNRPSARVNGHLRKQALKSNLLQPPQRFESYGRKPEVYGKYIRKDFNFPETKYAGISKSCLDYRNQESKCTSLSNKNSLYPKNLACKSQNSLSFYNKNNMKRNTNVNKKNVLHTPALFAEFSSGPSYRDVFNFPDVEYPLSASELWKPNYWIGYSMDTPSNTNLYCIDKKSNHTMNEEKPFRNFIKNNKFASHCGSIKGSEKNTKFGGNFNVTLKSTKICSNTTSYATNSSKCGNTIMDGDNEFSTLPRPEDCSVDVLPTEDKNNEFGNFDDDYTTDEPGFDDTSFYSQSTASPILSTNDLTCANTKLVENLSYMDDLRDYFMPL